MTQKSEPEIFSSDYVKSDVTTNADKVSSQMGKHSEPQDQKFNMDYYRVAKPKRVIIRGKEINDTDN